LKIWARKEEKIKVKKILFLVNNTKKADREKTTRDYLSKQFGPEIKIFLKGFSRVTIEINQNKVNAEVDGINLLEFDLIYFMNASKNLRLAATIAQFCQANKIPFIDKFYGTIEVPGNKLHSIVKLALNNIPVAPTVYISRRLLVTSSHEIVRKFGSPLFAKNLFSQRRLGLFLITKTKDFQKLLDSDYRGGYLFQKKINIAREYRLVVMGGKVVAVHEEGIRRFKNSRIVFDKSESIGGWVEPGSVPREMCQIAIKAAEVLGLDVAGVDACVEEGTGKIFLFEANWGPGLTLDPKISPELPGLAKYILWKLKA
jgi:glutathione synthase/RimK-type ligase-like ATP-grasp enzyme